MRNFKAVIIACLGIVSLGSCKKEFSPDQALEPKLTPSLFVVNNNNTVTALNPETGSKKWEVKVDNNVTATPIVVAGKLVVIDVTGKMYSINRTTGKITTTIPLGAPVVGTPVVIGSKFAVPVGSDIKMIDAGNNFNVDWQYGAASAVTTSLAVNRIDTSSTKQIFFASGTAVYAVNANTGLLTWQTDIFAAYGFSKSSVCAADNHFLYVGSDAGNLYSLNNNDGSVNWTYPTGSAIESSPISVGGNVMVGSNDRVFYSVDSATGLLRWKTQTGDRVISSPFVFNQNVYFGSNDFNMYCINIIDGTFRWKYLTYGALVSSPLAYNDVLYFNGEDQNVYALDAATSTQKWVYNAGGYMVSSMVLDNLTETIVPSISGNYPF